MPLTCLGKTSANKWAPMTCVEFYAAYPLLSDRLDVARAYRLCVCSDGLIRPECDYF